MFYVKLEANSQNELQEKINKYAVLPKQEQKKKQVETKKLYSTYEDLVYQVERDYNQRLGGHRASLKIAEEIELGEWSTGDKALDDRVLRYARINDIATTICNVNTRILLAYNWLEKNDMEAGSFIEGYKIVLSGGGTYVMSNGERSLTLAKPEIYSLLGVIGQVVEFKKEALNNHLEPDRIFRIWLERGAGKYRKTHATMGYCKKNNRIYSVDTGLRARNNQDITDNIKAGKLYNYSIYDLEYII